ncbi:MAG: STN domain-containing protein [Mangrovibacterium sp.]
MKLTFCIMLFSTMLVSAKSFSQETKLSLDYKEITISQLFQIIEDQSDYRFAYSQSNLDPNEKISIDVKNGNLDQILKTVLDQNRLTYSIIDRYVVISNPEFPGMKPVRSFSSEGPSQVKSPTLPALRCPVLP